MKKIFGLIAIVAMMIMILPIFQPVAHGAGQPPIALQTYYEGTIGWGPNDADPAICYDTASGQLLFNAYQNLIAFHGEEYYQFDPELATNVPTRTDTLMTVTNTSFVSYGTPSSDPTSTTWTNGSGTFTCTGWTDELNNGFGPGDAIRLTDGTTWRTWTVQSITGTTSVSMTLWRSSYVFNIRTSPTINFYTSTGAIYDQFGVKDAVYCLQRLEVIDIPGYPPWMFDKPLFDVADHTGWTNSTSMELAHLINDAIVGNTVANTVTINIGVPFPDNAFKQILANSWGGIYSSKYYITAGNWNGQLLNASEGYPGGAPNWWVDWAFEGQGLDINSARTGVGDAGLDKVTPTSYCGSGPYYVQTVDSTNFKVIFQRNPGFWEGWPAPGDTPAAGTGATGYLDTYEVDYIGDWTTRKADFLGGFIDSCAVPRGNMFEILDNVTKQPTTPGIITVANIVPPLSCDATQFTFVCKNTTSYCGTQSFPNGIYLDFFNNTNVRKAFEYSFNYTNYANQVFFGEADYRSNPLAVGLYPDYYNSTAAPMYYESLSNAEALLRNATVDGQNVWNSGFTFDLTFNTGNTVRQTACTMIANFFNTLSTFDGRVGNPFKVIVEEITWSQTITGYATRTLPMYDIGWLADFADADDFMRPYMYSYGAFAYFQGYSASNGWGTTKDTLIDQAVLTDDSTPSGLAARQAIYNKLQLQWYNDAPAIMMVNPRGRLFQWYWVKGWYYDAVYPARRIYTTWKQDSPWYDVSGGTPGVSDDVVNMRDIAYLVAHFNAKAPIPGVALDPKWVGVYGANGAVDPYGDRKSDMKDIAGAILNFNAHGPGHP